MKRLIAILMSVLITLSLAACGEPAGKGDSSSLSTTAATTKAVADATYVLAAKDTVELATWYSGDYTSFGDYYTSLEEMGWDIHDISLKDNQWNVVYDYAPAGYDSQSVNAALKWTVPETISVSDGKVVFSVGFEGQGTLLVNDEPAAPGIYGDANVFTSTKTGLRTTEIDYNTDLIRQDFSDSTLSYDMAGNPSQTATAQFEFDENNADKTLIIVVYVSINRNYLQQIYYYDRQ